MAYTTRIEFILLSKFCQLPNKYEHWCLQNEITAVALDNTQNALGIDTIRVGNSYGETIFENLATDFASRENNILDNIPGVDIKNVTYSIERTLMSHRYAALNISQVEATINSVITKLLIISLTEKKGLLKKQSL